MSDPQNETEQVDPAEPGADQLTDELARKYDPERMLGMVSRRAGKGQRLDHSIRAKYERRFGVDLGHVRVYSGEFAEEFNRQRGAHAVTIGSTGMILMGGSADKSMGSAAGQALLAHELTHVAQAHKGLHRKATFSGSMPFTEEHEAEAEAVEHSVEAAGGDHGAATHAATESGSAKMASEESLKKAIEEVTERVKHMAADTARNQVLRNGSQRRA
ncbi:MAG TPA: DUF4157 domain-containing protein [Kofleriaceae bacterium]|nr:DUF4157 domain-containing protein [Kofleriaceae bacterium]